MISLSIEIDVEAIVEGFPHDEQAAFALIKALDVKFADYDFTKILADHFSAEIAKEDAKMPNPHGSGVTHTCALLNSLAVQPVAQTGVPDAVDVLEMLASFVPQYIGSVAANGSAAGVVQLRILEQVNKAIELLAAAPTPEGDANV